MLENPGEELHFGEVYRQILQEAWLPDGGEEWYRLGKSRRGYRPAERGLTSPPLSPELAAIRQCFSDCAAAWREIPWTLPFPPTCDTRQPKKYWHDEKARRGVMCSYYDLYMRYCMRFCLDTGCLPPVDYLLEVNPPLTGVECFKVYDLSFPNACGDISMISGPGQFVAPNEWVSPSWGTEGILCFRDANGAQGSTTYRFTLPYWGEAINWPYTNPEEIFWNSSEAIYVAGGIPPYTWEVSGIGFTLGAAQTQGTSNTLIAAAWTDPTATVTITDICGNPAYGYVPAQDTNWYVCASGSQGGCCYPPSYPCESAVKWYGPYRKIIFGCGTRPGYGTSGASDTCEGVYMEVFKADCPQEDGAICHWGFFYWGGTEE